MKLTRFSEKLPVLGSNILVVHENGGIGITEFTLHVRKAVLNKEGYDYLAQDYYTDDPSEDGEYDIRCADFWCYPSSIKLPKKKNDQSK
jgi:hypothetical protein